MASALFMRNRNYRLLFSAGALTNLGDGLILLALPWLATLMTRDPVAIGAVAAAGRVPWLLFALPAGVIIDRSDQR
ncbi:MFS transporter, partial [Planktotalea frisia]